jgi:DNA modification methylase
LSKVEHIAEGVTLYLGDCREILPTLPAADLSLTDPPYGIGQDGGRGHRKRSGARVQEKLGWDKNRPASETFALVMGAATDHVIWGGNYFADLLPPKMGWLYWQKLIGGDFSDGELAWTTREAALKEFTYRKTNAEMEHPTQKPVALLKWCIEFFPDAKSVIDPFMGVGSTGVAAVKLGRKFTGIEIEPKYFDIARRRIGEALRQPDMFIEPPKPLKQEAML